MTSTRKPGNTPPQRRNIALAQRVRARLQNTQPNCHICGNPINWTADKDHPQSFVVDHVTPLKLGGPDTPDNMRAAHRECNSKKRARPYAPIIRRSNTLT